MVTERPVCLSIPQIPSVCRTEARCFTRSSERLRLPAHNGCVSITKRREITENDVVGLKYFSKLTPLLTRLHQCGCVRDKAGNRTLHFDSIVRWYCCFFLTRSFSRSVPSSKHRN